MRYVYVILVVAVCSVLENLYPWFPAVGVTGGACYLICKYYTLKDVKDRDLHL